MWSVDSSTLYHVTIMSNKIYTRQKLLHKYHLNRFSSEAIRKLFPSNHYSRLVFNLKSKSWRFVALYRVFKYSLLRLSRTTFNLAVFVVLEMWYKVDKVRDPTTKGSCTMNMSVRTDANTSTHYTFASPIRFNRFLPHQKNLLSGHLNDFPIRF